ncbi:cyclin-dependent kinase G-2-like [Silene latifolia]|uniref:cyclin-dependent kinase G-2-like n=1 Tax=Silene latifolia TaxID=37657 RepID=UPI003D78390D
MAAAKVSLTRGVDLSHVSKRGSVERKGDFGFGVKIRSEDVEWRVLGDYDDVMEFDEGVDIPLQKKRKLSPGLWDVEDDVGGRSSLTVEDDREPGQLDEEDFTRAHHISTSRWAVDVDDGLVVAKRRSCSPESGVTQRDVSDGSGNLSSGSGGRCVGSGTEYESEDEDYMDLDNGEDEIASESDSDSENGGVACGRRNMLLGCSSVFDYERLGRISEGSYGIVHKARDKENGEIVALKKLKMDKDNGEGFPIYFLREINTLLALNHPSIVNVREVVVDDSVRNGFDNIFMVMDYVEHDLKALMKSRKQCFSQSQVKGLMLQLLEGVKYLHDNWILHRDLKTSNLLVNDKGDLKICDFGMARQYGSPLKPYTSLVVTLWYRAPELLLGAKEYSTAVDMWSVGCIMAELLTNKPLFDGKTEAEQINKIFKMLGTPNANTWPSYGKLPGSKLKYVHQPHNQLHKQFPRALFTGSPVLSDSGLDLLSRLLTYEPEKRITAEEALNHRWFQEVPLPSVKDFMSTSATDKAMADGH